MNSVNNTERPLIAGLGEILWDVFPDGPRFGGAPANFACNAAGLAGDSADVAMVSAVGNDELGSRALAALEAHRVATDGVARRPQPTGTVNVTLDESGKASYGFASDTAWDNLIWTDDLRALAACTQAVCFGTLGQRSSVSRDVIQSFVAATPAECLRVFDINLRPPYWSEDVFQQSLTLASVLKLNEDELPVLARLLDLQGDDESLLAAINERCDLQLSVLTRGASGALLVRRTGERAAVSGQKVQVIDTVGAGDSFTAAIVVGLLKQLPLRATAEWAARVAAFVCTQPGATPELPDSVAKAPEA